MSRDKSRFLFLEAWLFILCLIPVLSVTGRGLRRLVYENLSPEVLAGIFFTVSVLLMGMLLWWMKRRRAYQPPLYLISILALFLMVPMFLPRLDERLHFLVFGSFGFFSLLSFPAPVAITMVSLTGALDEVLQWQLPDRVGDWRDVGFNVLAGLGGIAAAWLLRKS